MAAISAAALGSDATSPATRVREELLEVLEQANEASHRCLMQEEFSNSAVQASEPAVQDHLKRILRIQNGFILRVQSFMQECPAPQPALFVRSTSSSRPGSCSCDESVKVIKAGAVTKTEPKSHHPPEIITLDDDEGDNGNKVVKAKNELTILHSSLPNQMHPLTPVAPSAHPVHLTNSPWAAKFCPEEAPALPVPVGFCADGNVAMTCNNTDLESTTSNSLTLGRGEVHAIDSDNTYVLLPTPPSLVDLERSAGRLLSKSSSLVSPTTEKDDEELTDEDVHLESNQSFLSYLGREHPKKHWAILSEQQIARITRRRAAIAAGRMIEEDELDQLAQDVVSEHRKLWKSVTTSDKGMKINSPLANHLAKVGMDGPGASVDDKPMAERGRHHKHEACKKVAAFVKVLNQSSDEESESDSDEDELRCDEEETKEALHERNGLKTKGGLSLKVAVKRSAPQQSRKTNAHRMSIKNIPCEFPVELDILAQSFHGSGWVYLSEDQKGGQQYIPYVTILWGLQNVLVCYVGPECFILESTLEAMRSMFIQNVDSYKDCFLAGNTNGNNRMKIFGRVATAFMDSDMSTIEVMNAYRRCENPVTKRKACIFAGCLEAISLKFNKDQMKQNKEPKVFNFESSVKGVRLHYNIRDLAISLLYRACACERSRIQNTASGKGKAVFHGVKGGEASWDASEFKIIRDIPAPFPFTVFRDDKRNKLDPFAAALLDVHQIEKVPI